jgi:hypothetical protein
VIPSATFFLLARADSPKLVTPPKAPDLDQPFRVQKTHFVVAHPDRAALEFFVRLERVVFADPIDVHGATDDLALLAPPTERLATNDFEAHQIHPFPGKDGELERVAGGEGLTAGQEQSTGHVAQTADVKVEPLRV